MPSVYKGLSGQICITSTREIHRYPYLIQAETMGCASWLRPGGDINIQLSTPNVNCISPLQPTTTSLLHQYGLSLRPSDNFAPLLPDYPLVPYTSLPSTVCNCSPTCSPSHPQGAQPPTPRAPARLPFNLRPLRTQRLPPISRRNCPRTQWETNRPYRELQ